MPDRPSVSEKVFLGLNSEKLANRGLAILVVYAAVRSLVAAASRPFWYDEICTYIMAHQPSVHSIWSALERAADGQGPAYYIIERAASAIVRDQEIALRLPSIFGYCCLTICIFIFVRRRVGSTYALICSLIPFMTVLFEVYAIEARAYSLVVACIAAALVCYQRASSWRWALPMGMCLALAESLHYYAVFAFVPIGLAEGVRFLRTKGFRIGVWLALLCGAAPLAIFWPLLADFRAYLGVHFWARPTLVALGGMYGWFFGVVSWCAVALVAVLALGVVGAALPVATRKTEIPAARGSMFDEQLLTLALLGLPFVGYAAARIAHGGLTGRYMLPTVLGVPLALGWILPRLERRSLTLLVAFVVFGAGVREGLFWIPRIAYPADLKANAVSIEQLVGTAGHEDLPVAFSDGVEFLAVAHYADPYWRDRFVYLVDPKKELAYTKSDAMDKELRVLRTLAPINAFDFAAFAAQHPTFLLYSDDGREGGDGIDRLDWWPDRLVDDGSSLNLLVSKGSRKIYLVGLRRNSN